MYKIISADVANPRVWVEVTKTGSCISTGADDILLTADEARDLAETILAELGD